MKTLRVQTTLAAAILSMGLVGCSEETDDPRTRAAEARSGEFNAVQRITPKLEDCGDPVALQELVIELVNDFRSEVRDCGNGIRQPAEPLIWDVRLENAAIVHSDDMANENFFNHTGSDGSRPSDRMDREGYIWKAAAVENLGPDREGFRDVLNAWKASTAGHCDNLMIPQLKHVGVACIYTDSADQEYYWALKMGSN